MRLLIFSALLGLFSNHAIGAIVLSAQLDDLQKNLLVKVDFLGGCENHQFELKLLGCRKQLPAQCVAFLVEKTFDRCDDPQYAAIKFSLEKQGLTEAPYKGSRLIIYGDVDYQGESRSNAAVQLPN